MTPELRQQLIDGSREAGVAFVEDLEHIRRILGSDDPDKGDVRRLSGVLRRLLIDAGGDLPRIAAPRVGRLTLVAPDNQPVYVATRNRHTGFFGSGGVSVFGNPFRAALLDDAPPPLVLNGFNPDRRIPLAFEGFVGQKVLYLKGEWVARKDVIKYMAHVASGVHSGVAKEPVERTIACIRHAMKYDLASPDTLNVFFNPKVLDTTDLPFRFDPNALDPVLIEVLATAQFLTDSQDVISLETMLRKEFEKAS